MRFLIIPDKFKGSLTSEEVFFAFKQGVGQVKDDASFHFVKASDGGDGFLDAIATYKDCKRVAMKTLGPLGREISSYYLLDEKSKSAYIELANSSGMELLEPAERNAALTTTFGSGQQIGDAIKKGAKKIYVGLGGSATNDGGMGIANALGFEFLDAHEKPLAPIGKNLKNIHRISKAENVIDTAGIQFFAINDVKNPLFGRDGAAFVYAAQKGADAAMITELDKGLRNLSDVYERQFGSNFSEIPGSGAAGGTGFGLKAFFKAEFLSGVEFILELCGVKEVLDTQKFDYIVTGEGRIDNQTLQGKLIQGVMELANRYDIPVLAVCGKLDVPLETLTSNGVKDVIEIGDPNKSLEYNMENAKNLLQGRVSEYFKSLY
ncbi:glycerate kinase [Maribacter sp. 4G9]|uniref:glycerate kinase n=1 Tax=Maribacter sp. 4G9 TaxID=1889777 RepID=UPI000C14C7E5|nr:glycerate kinase [Maribacter sp. 4G9]PIB38181.1 hypothetical protein BFP75_17380 [Maribacter sp. 4G9]